MNRAAIYVHGRIVTGIHHGEAYKKLTAQEKCENVCSGFLDEEHNKFLAEQKEFYLKRIILVRHADAENGSVTEYGRSQIQKAAIFLNAFVSLAEYSGFTSPVQRCQETAAEFSNEINLQFKTDEQLAESNESLESLKKLLENLPSKSFLISHCNLIATLAQLATGINMQEMKIDNCCIIFIKDNTIVRLGNL